MPEIRQYVQDVTICASSTKELNDKVYEIMVHFAKRGLKVAIESQSIESFNPGFSCHKACVRAYKSWQQGTEEYTKFFDEINV